MSKLDFLAEQQISQPEHHTLPSFKVAKGVINPIFADQTASVEQNLDSNYAKLATQSVELIDIELIDDPLVPQRWHYDQRIVAEMAKSLLREGDGDALKGQQQPILLLNKQDGRYELIEGKTRVLAFRDHHLGKYIKAIISSDIDRKTAYRIGFVANEGRNQLTDYDKGMSFKALLTNNVFATQDELCLSLGITKATLSKLLCFSKLPESTLSIIERDKSRFGYNTAQLLYTLSEKAPESHLNAIAEKILAGWSVALLAAHVSKFSGEKPKRKKQPKRVSVIGQFGQLECNATRLALDLDVSGLTEEERNTIWIDIDNILRNRLSTHVDDDQTTISPKNDA